MHTDQLTTANTYPFERKLIDQAPSGEEISNFFHTIKKYKPKSSTLDLGSKTSLQVSTENSLQAFQSLVNKTISDFQLQCIGKMANHQQSKKTNSIINITLRSPSSVTVSVDSFCGESEEDNTDATRQMWNSFPKNPYSSFTFLTTAQCDSSTQADNKSSQSPKAENEDKNLISSARIHEASTDIVEAREKANQAVKKWIASVKAIPKNTEKAITNRIEASKRAIKDGVEEQKRAAHNLVQMKVEEARSLLLHRIEIAKLRVIAFPNRLLTGAADELRTARGKLVHFIYVTPVNAVDNKLEDGKRKVTHAVELGKTMMTNKIEASKMAVYEEVKNKKKEVEEKINEEIQEIRKSLKNAVSLANIFKKVNKPHTCEMFRLKKLCVSEISSRMSVTIFTTNNTSASWPNPKEKTLARLPKQKDASRIRGQQKAILVLRAGSSLRFYQATNNNSKCYPEKTRWN